ncbi:MAG: hypothetical protein V1493_02760 [Candidatus Diapherotrites archaeon]
MELKEKILAVGIALVLYLLASNITGQIFQTYPYANYGDDCYIKYPFPEDFDAEDPLLAQRQACTGEWQAKADFNSLLVSISMVAIGLAALALGYFAIKLDSISTGIMGGGVLCILQSAFVYYAVSKNQWEKTLLLLVAFIVLLAIAYFKFAKKPKK